MQRIAFLLVLALGSISAAGQSILWESDAEARPPISSLQPFIFSQSDILSDDFDGDGLTDLVTSVIYRDSLFFRIRVMDEVTQFWADDSYYSSSSQFLGYLKIPDIDGEPAAGNRPLVFGNIEGNNIIGILITRIAAGQESVSFQQLDIGADYRFLSFTDFNRDGVVDFLVFNQDAKRLQAWQF